MKKIFLYIVICLAAIVTGCDKDGEFITVSGLESSALVTSESGIVLSKENKDAPMLAFSWNESELVISNESMSIPEDIPNVMIEISDKETFEDIQYIEPETHIYSFTGGQLNTLAKNFGFTPGESTPMYFRVNTAYGVNTEPYYSNVLAVNITSYTIDMSKGFILNADKEETGFVLYSPDSDGEYFGFTGTSAWGNWYMQEGDGTTWGNDGVDGSAFLLSSDEATMWNFWYPGLGGCYYTTLSTSGKEWTATYIPALNISGDVTGEMVFDKTEVKWFISVTTTVDNATVQVSCDNASLYNLSTSTDDDAAISKELGFIADASGALSFDMSVASATDIAFGTAGDYTLTFYLADPANWYYEITEGKTVVEDPISEFLYLPGVDDLTSGAWTFDNYLRLLSEDDSTFAGIVSVNSEWGYTMSLEEGNWDNHYKLGDSEGTLLVNGENNITAPDAGMYLIQADLKNLTYSHSEVTGLSYAGFNGDWAMVAMDASSVEGVYTSSVTINAASEWGAKLYLNGEWDYFFGGAEGKLYFGGDGITDDASIAAGNYDMVADVKNQTYTLLGDEVYIVGINDVWNFTSVVLSKVSTGVYSGSVSISADSPYGMVIHLDQSWNRYYGGSFSSIGYLGENINDVKDLAYGAYDITVDFINNTVVFEAQ
ncbi:DUF5114 domain-containing protein [Plebeiibacterium marinum]|uniref:DUF5114 domain-containing protein n=1 Tax=Plebeiibacterium marinum TaxID=2992111 RepID=A0AAE3MCP9_9BACT|nr:DUF5114 domain-containing protein [Plebeiobacterium marinum]MCW3805341.1 DUF5114 domain-containing protein [Plebeiobacterium marinum]